MSTEQTGAWWKVQAAVDQEKCSGWCRQHFFDQLYSKIRKCKQTAQLVKISGKLLNSTVSDPDTWSSSWTVHCDRVISVLQKSVNFLSESRFQNPTYSGDLLLVFRRQFNVSSMSVQCDVIENICLSHLPEANDVIDHQHPGCKAKIIQRHY